MVVARTWSEQRVLMRAFSASEDQTRPTIHLQGEELAIGPAGTDPHGEWGIHVEPPVDGKAQELREALQSAAKRLAGTGVTVNAVLPGPTLSEGVADMLKDEVAKSGKSLEDAAADFVMAHRPSSVIQRAATVEEVANMVVYVSSTQASATSGAALRVDGGVVDTIA